MKVARIKQKCLFKKDDIVLITKIRETCVFAKKGKEEWYVDNSFFSTSPQVWLKILFITFKIFGYVKSRISKR